MAIGIGRRQFISALGGAVAGWPLTARAQLSAMPVVGYLGLAPASSAAFRLAAMRDGLHDLGYSDGNNIAIETRFAEGPDQLRDFAIELVKRPAVVIATSGNAATLAAK
jgi:putative ABC transport system substrate-binding protein